MTKTTTANGTATASNLHPSLAEVQMAITIVNSRTRNTRHCVRRWPLPPCERLLEKRRG
jgi:hypothetical protein